MSRRWWRDYAAECAAWDERQPRPEHGLTEAVTGDGIRVRVKVWCARPTYYATFPIEDEPHPTETKHDS